MRLLGTKVLSVAALIAHSLTLFTGVTVEVFQLQPRTSYNLVLVGIFSIALSLTAVIIFRFFRSLWHTHCAIQEFFQRQTRFANKRMQLLLMQEPYKLTHSHIHITYQDPNGKRVQITKHQEILVLAEHIDQLWDRGIMCDHQVANASVDETSFWTSLGTIGAKETDGAGYNIRTDLSKQYKRGEKLNRDLKYVLLNSYCRRKENFVLTAGKFADRVTIDVTVPPPAVLYDPAVVYTVGNTRVPFDNQAPASLSMDARTLTWSVDEPAFGEKFILNWCVNINPAPTVDNHKPHHKGKHPHKKKKKGSSITIKKPEEQSSTALAAPNRPLVEDNRPKT